MRVPIDTECKRCLIFVLQRTGNDSMTSPIGSTPSQSDPPPRVQVTSFEWRHCPLVAVTCSSVKKTGSTDAWLPRYVHVRKRCLWSGVDIGHRADDRSCESRETSCSIVINKYVEGVTHPWQCAYQRCKDGYLHRPDLASWPQLSSMNIQCTRIRFHRRSSSDTFPNDSRHLHPWHGRVSPSVISSTRNRSLSPLGRRWMTICNVCRVSTRLKSFWSTCSKELSGILDLTSFSLEIRSLSYDFLLCDTSRTTCSVNTLH